MAIAKITKSNFAEIVMQKDKTILIDFFADWCAPCRMLAPFIEEIAEENPDIVVGKVNVDEEPELAMQFNVSSIPAVFAVRDGNIIDSAVGFTPKAVLLEMLK